MDAVADSSDIAVDLPPRPYPGLRPFTSSEWQIFFGREIMAEEVLRRVSQQRLVVVHGSSGCGKSSLVYAGVIPQLERRRKRRRIRLLTATVRPGRSPVRSLATEFARLCFGSQAQSDIDAIHRILISGRDALVRLESKIAEWESRQQPAISAAARSDRTEFCLFIDQFEELFRYAREGDPEEARLFADILVGLGAFDSADAEDASQVQAKPSRISAIVTVRSEFLGDCARYSGLAEAVNRTQYLLPRMERADLLRAIREPAALYGGTVDWDLAERLASDAAAEDDPLPLVQHALMRLWEVNGRKLTLDHYLAATAESESDPSWSRRTGLSLMLAAHANEVLTRATAASEPDKPGAASAASLRQAAEHVFRALTDIDAEGRATRRPIRLKRLRAVVNIDDGALEHILDAFRVDGVSFLTPYLRRDEAGKLDDERDIIDISHEALIRAWPQIADPRVDKQTGRPRGWLHLEFQDGLIWRALAVQAQSFANDPKACLDPATTGQREPWYESVRHRPAWAARYLINREPDKAPEEQPEWQAVAELMKASHIRREAELQRVQTLQRRINRYLAPALVVGVLVAVGAGSFAAWQRMKAVEVELATQRDRTAKAELAMLSAEAARQSEIARSRTSQAALSELQRRYDQLFAEFNATGRETEADQTRAETVPDEAARAFVISSSSGVDMPREGAIWIGTNNTKTPVAILTDADENPIEPERVRAGGSYFVSKSMVLRDGAPEAPESSTNYVSKPGVSIVPQGTRIIVLEPPKKYAREGDHYWASIRVDPDIPPVETIRTWVRTTAAPTGTSSRDGKPLYRFAITLDAPATDLAKIGRVEYGDPAQAASIIALSSDLNSRFAVNYQGLDCSAVSSLKVRFEFGIARDLALDPCYAKDPPQPRVSSAQPVAWWMVFKFNAAAFPGCSGDARRICTFGGDVQSYRTFGQQYVFASSANPTLQTGSDCAGTTNDPTGATFDQIYNEFRHYVVWNDQFYDDPQIEGCGASCGAPWGGSKGVLAWNEAGEGLVLQVTTPSWPGSGSKAFPRKTDGNTLGCTKDNNVQSSQHFFATRLSKDDVVKVLKAMLNASVVTDPKNPQIVNNGGPPDVQQLVAALGMKSSSVTATKDVLSGGITLLSKPAKLNVPPWQMVSALLGGPALRVASWWANPTIESTTASTPIGCWDASLGQAGAVEIAKQGRWGDREFSLVGGAVANSNHAKIGVSTDGRYAIFGDLNQQGALSAKGCGISQNGRGGLFFVLPDAALTRGLQALLGADPSRATTPDFGIVIGQDATLKDAQDEVARAQKKDFASPQIYLRDGRYQTVLLFDSPEDRDKALPAARSLSPWSANAMPVRLSSWCPNLQDNQTHKLCIQAKSGMKD